MIRGVGPDALELKIPPAVVVATVALIMWRAVKAVPSVDLSLSVRAFAGAGVITLGLVIILAGGVAFRRAHTTVNPTKPASSSSLVVSGVYRFTRNPMYLGMLLVLVGWAAFLMNFLARSIVSLFVLYINRFQIIPEERALSQSFGAEYISYQAKVRRWL